MIAPPRLAARVVRWSASRLSWGETACGDLAEEHSALAARRGRWLSGLWYWGQAFLLMATAGRRLAAHATASARTFLFIGDRPMSALAKEVRIAVRALRRYPLITAAIVLTLALGLGVNAAAFSMLDALVLRPFSLHEVERLAVVSEWSEDNSTPHDPDESVAFGNFIDWKKQAATFEGLAAIGWWQVNFSGGDEPERVLGFRVSADFFPMLKLTPTLGRFISEADTTNGPHKVVVLGYGLWQRRFAARPDIVGQTVKIDGEFYDVIGIAPEGFDFPTGASIWGPLDGGPAAQQDRRNRFLTVIGRLAPGRTLTDARAEMKVIGDRLRQEHFKENELFSPLVQAFTTGMIDPGMDQILGMIQIGAVLVLAIGGANIANLLLARGWDRRREIALRLAIGAGRARLLRQLLIESAVLAAIAVPVSLAFAWGSLRILKSAMPARILPYVPGWNTMDIDGRLLLVISAAALVASVLFSIFPALQASRPNVVNTLREGGRSVSGNRSDAAPAQRAGRRPVGGRRSTSGRDWTYRVGRTGICAWRPRLRPRGGHHDADGAGGRDASRSRRTPAVCRAAHRWCLAAAGRRIGGDDDVRPLGRFEFDARARRRRPRRRRSRPPARRRLSHRLLALLRHDAVASSRRARVRHERHGGFNAGRDCQQSAREQALAGRIGDRPPAEDA